LAKLAKNSWRLEDEEIQVGGDVHQPFLRSKALLELDHPENHKAGEGIFVLTTAEVEKLKLTQEEQKLLRPFHYAEEIDSYCYNLEVRRYLIYTPVGIAKDIESAPNKYPNIKFHLDKYQSVITSDHKPYGIHRARQPEWFEDPEKIICVRKTRYPKFTVVPEAWYGDQAVLIIRLTKHTQISPYFAAAILNSKLAHFWLFQQKRQGNQLQVDKEVLLHFPFPEINLSKPQDEKLYDDVINLAIKAVEQRRELETTKKSEKDIFGEKTKELQAALEKTKGEIDQLVFVLYGLTTKEIQQVESVAGGT